VTPDKFTALTPELYDYVVEHTREDALLERLRTETAASLPDRAQMQISPDQGALMTLLVRAIGARRALELGTFTGYSAICIARGLGEEGRLVSCDVSEEWTAIAHRYFEEAGLEDRIELRIGPALETLAALAADEPFDFAFIDADKVNYPNYWDPVVELLRPGGLAVVDNTFYGGLVIADEMDERVRASTDAVRRTNRMIAEDERVDEAMLGVADGITLALKR
jgi:caffeoyl-CoA O-methyltransferase